MKLGVAFHRFGPYHMARLKSLANLEQLVGIEFSTVDNTYSWKQVEKNAPFERVKFLSDYDIDECTAEEIRRQAIQVLNRVNPDVVAIPGWASRGSLATLEWCVSNNKPAILMSDSTAEDFQRYPMREFIKRRVVRLFSTGLVAGVPHVRYLESLGMRREKIFVGFDVVDNQHFITGALEAKRRMNWLRAELNLHQPFFLATCRFIPEKNLSNLLLAYAQYRCKSGGQPWQLVLLGDGPKRYELEMLCQELNVLDAVHFVGFRQYDELPVFYGLASALILPSTKDTWGLVVNEAMASGLPVLVSNRCGCVADLVRDGVNGYTFDPYNVNELAGLMVKITSNESALQKMSQASRDIIARWTPEFFAENLLKAAQAACSDPLPKFSWFDRLLLRGLIWR